MEETIKTRLEEMRKSLDEKEKIVSGGNINYADPEFKKLSKEISDIRDLLDLYDRFKKLESDLEGAKELLESSDPDMREMAEDEIKELSSDLEKIEEDITIATLPKDPYENKDVIMEIRAGTGGDEAGLFAADLYRMYCKYAEKNSWRVEVISENQTGVGGYKEIVFSVAGEKVHDKLKFEMGGHRVQRVPTTESSGRIHTSAVTVAVLPEMEEAEIDISEADIRIDVFRSSGPGGQSVNTTDSAVRITHIPTGLVVSCQDEKSQHKNKAKALRVLRARLQEATEKAIQQEYSETRRTQIGSGDRSQKIRTYNFPQNRITDHRIKKSYFNMTEVLDGNLDECTEDLIQYERAELLGKEYVSQG